MSDILTDLHAGRVHLVCLSGMAKNPAFIPLTPPSVTAQIKPDAASQIGRALNDYKRNAQVENAAKNAPGFIEFIDKTVGEIRSLAGDSPVKLGYESHNADDLLKWLRDDVKTQDKLRKATSQNLVPNIAASDASSSIHGEAIKAEIRDYLGLGPDTPDHELLSALEAAMQAAGVIDSPATMAADTQANNVAQGAQIRGIVSDYQARYKCSFGEAWNLAQPRHPFAFQNRAPSGVTTLSAVDVVIRDQARAEQGRQLRAAIARHQVAGVSFQEAFNRAQSENPSLFRE